MIALATSPLPAPQSVPGFTDLKRTDDEIYPELIDYSDHSSAFLAMNRDTARFQSPRAPGMIAYRAAGGYLFQIGGVYAPKEQRRLLLDDFQAFARSQGRRVCALQLQRDDAALYGEAGFRINQIGLSYGTSLDGFTLRGKAFMKLRNKVRRAERAGVEVVELGQEAPRDQAAWDELEEITQRWVGTKGAKLLEFMVGELGTHTESARRVFVARQEGRAVGFVSYAPVYGTSAGWSHDLSRRVPEAPPGVMELINVTALERFRAEGAAHLHFGFTPFAGRCPEMDDLPGRSPMVSWLVDKLATHGDAVYPARSQVAYKRKWRPDQIVPEYIAFKGRFRLSCLWSLLRLTRSL